MRIRHTLALDRVVVSEAYASALAERSDLTVLVPPTEWRFDDAGNFDPATDLLRGSAGLRIADCRLRIADCRLRNESIEAF